MRDKTLAADAKEQGSVDRNAAPSVARFQRICGQGGLEELENAMLYYQGLPLAKRREIRLYSSKNGYIDLKKAHDMTFGIYPSGTAGHVGLLMLRQSLWGEYIRSLDERKGKRTSYLNPRRDNPV